MNKLSVLLLVVATFFSTSALAQQATVYKSDDAIILYGLQPNSTVVVEVTKSIERGAIANSCGILLIRSATSFSIDGQTVNPNSNLTVRELPDTCTFVGYPVVFRTSGGAIALLGKTPGAAYTIALPNYKTVRRTVSNDCGFIRLNEKAASSLNLPTITGGRADFQVAKFIQNKPLLCVKGVLYTAFGFNLKSAVAVADGSTTSGTTTVTQTSSSTTVSSQTSQPVAMKNTAANKLIVASIPPGTYVVRNASNPAKSKTYTVTGSSSCFIVERNQLGNPTNFIISRQGLTFPINWATVVETPTIPSC